MKKSKLLTLSAALLMAITVTGCNNAGGSSSVASSEAASSEVASSEVVSSEEASSSEVSTTPAYVTTLTDAAEYLYQNYGKDYTGTAMTDSIQLPKKVVMNGGSVIVAVEWSCTVTAGSQAAFAIQEIEGNKNFVSFYCGYYDGLVTEATTVALTATLTVDGHSATLTDLIGATHGSIIRTADVLVLNTYAQWAAGAKGDAFNIKATVVGVVATGSSSAGSFYAQDAEGHGYYAYKPASNKTAAKVGDSVIISGTKTTYSGQDEFNSGCTYKNLGTSTQAVTYTDATEAWKAATAASTTALGSDFQNTPVELKNCTPTKVSGSYYYFTVDGGTTEFNVYDTYYFLSDEQRAQFIALYTFAKDNNYTFDVKGVATVYSSNYQIYGIADNANIISLSSDEAKAKYDASALDFAGYKKLYPSSGSYDLPTTTVCGSTVTWSLGEGTSADNFAITDGKLVVTAPAAGADAATGTLVATVTNGEASETKSYALTSRYLTDEDFANGALEQMKDLSIIGGRTLTLPAPTGDYADVTVTWAVKEGDTTGATIANGVLSVPNPEANTTVTLVATATHGEVTKTADVVVKVNKVLTIAEFEAAQDTTNVQYVKGIVVAKNSATDASGSYELFDGTDYIFSYNRTTANLGDEILVSTKYSTNNGVVQLTSISTEVLSSNNTYTITPNVELTVAEVAEKITAAQALTSTEQETVKNEWGEAYNGKVIKLTGYVVQSGTYYNMGATADASATPASIYSAGTVGDQFKALAGKKVEAVVFYRGNNIKSGNMQFQLVSVTEVTE